MFIFKKSSTSDVATFFRRPDDGSVELKHVTLNVF